MNEKEFGLLTTAFINSLLARADANALSELLTDDQKKKFKRLSKKHLKKICEDPDVISDFQALEVLQSKLLKQPL
jgi:hypothetical protein